MDRQDHLVPRGKWERWNTLLEQRSDMPVAQPITRRIVVPLVCAVAVVMVLVVLMPPFVCDVKRSTVSIVRLALWALIGGGLCAILTAQGVFTKWTSS